MLPFDSSGLFLLSTFNASPLTPAAAVEDDDDDESEEEELLLLSWLLLLLVQMGNDEVALVFDCNFGCGDDCSNEVQ